MTRGTIEIIDGRVFVNGVESPFSLADENHPVMKKVSDVLASTIRDLAYEEFKASSYKEVSKTPRG